MSESSPHTGTFQHVVDPKTLKANRRWPRRRKMPHGLQGGGGSIQRKNNTRNSESKVLIFPSLPMPKVSIAREDVMAQALGINVPTVLTN